MVFLDTQIVSAILPNIAANLGATLFEAESVQSSYLIAEALAILVSAMMLKSLGSANVYMIAATLFAVTSLLCGTSESLTELVAYRFMQGFSGGLIIPAGFHVVYTEFKGREKNSALALLGMVTVISPTVGPKVGSIMADEVGWQWAFFINLVPMGLTIAVTIFRVGLSKLDFSSFREFNYVQFLNVFLFIILLEYCFKYGFLVDWFNDLKIVFCAFFAVVFIALYAFDCRWNDKNIVDWRVVNNPSVLLGIANVSILIYIHYAMPFIIPLYFHNTYMTESKLIADVLLAAGVFQMLSSVIVAILPENRSILYCSVGMTALIVSMFYMSGLSLTWKFHEWILLQGIRGVIFLVTMINAYKLIFHDDDDPKTIADKSTIISFISSFAASIGVVFSSNVISHQYYSHQLELQNYLPDTILEYSIHLHAAHLTGLENESLVQAIRDLSAYLSLPLFAVLLANLVYIWRSARRVVLSH